MMGQLVSSKPPVALVHSRAVFPELVISYEVRNFELLLVTKFSGP